MEDLNFRKGDAKTDVFGSTRECFTDMPWVSSENSAIWSELCPSKSVQWDMRLF